MASSKARGTFVPFSEATKIEKLDSHTYRVNLLDAYCIGAVPNGGYAGSCVLAAASAHLSERNQRDMLTVHFEYPDQAGAGPAIVKVEEVKLSRRFSTIHLSLWQGGLVSQAPWITPSISRRAVIALANFTDLQTMSGMSSQTGYEVTPAAAIPEPLPDFNILKAKGADDTWELSTLPQASSSSIWRSLHNWCFYMPRGEPVVPGMVDMWVRMASGERIKQGTLAYLVDSFPWNLHTFLPSPEMRKLMAAASQPQGKAQATRGEAPKQEDERADLWFPTVVLNMEAKMALPEEGVEWLAVRIASKQIKDGRFDLDMQVRNVDGELVVLSHHVAMIVSIMRNTGKKGGSAKAAL
ncbi:thioesterase family protein [Hypomontagnella monticulosa]|nr:thioesterase family protein [Hypomontagnella monticulosa]